MSITKRLIKWMHVSPLLKRIRLCILWMQGVTNVLNADPMVVDQAHHMVSDARSQALQFAQIAEANAREQALQHVQSVEANAHAQTLHYAGS